MITVDEIAKAKKDLNIKFISGLMEALGEQKIFRDDYLCQPNEIIIFAGSRIYEEIKKECEKKSAGHDTEKQQGNE